MIHSVNLLNRGYYKVLEMYKVGTNFSHPNLFRHGIYHDVKLHTYCRSHGVTGVKRSEWCLPDHVTSLNYHSLTQLHVTMLTDNGN